MKYYVRAYDFDDGEVWGLHHAPKNPDEWYFTRVKEEITYSDDPVKAFEALKTIDDQEMFLGSCDLRGVDYIGD